MSTPPPPPPAAATEAPPSRSRPLLLTAAGLVVAVTAAVLVFGVSRPPALESLADHPGDAPSDALAWLGWSDGDHCLGVAWPDARVTEPFCDEHASELLGWVDGDTVLVASWQPDARAIEVDVRDGTIRGNQPRPQWHERDMGGALTVTRDGDELLVLGDDGTQLWRVDAPATYRIDRSSIAPDGAHAAFVDNADRLLVVRTDGSGPPRIWAQDVSGFPEPAWSSERVAGLDR